MISETANSLCMENAKEKLQRRVAAYRDAGAVGVGIEQLLNLVRDDTAASSEIIETPQDDLGPAHFRGRARHYRQMADRERNATRSAKLREVAVMFEERAALKERGEG